MKQMMMFAVAVCATVLFGVCCMAGDKEDTLPARNDLDCIRLSDGFVLKMYASVQPRPNSQKAAVRVALRSENSDSKLAVVWVSDLTSLNYVPGEDRYYGLVKVMKDQFFIFAMWNGRYCFIDRRTGRVLKSGEGDDILRRYDGLIPLRLTIRTNSTLTFVKGEELKGEMRQFLEMTRQGDTFLRSESVSSSKLKKFYVVHFGEPVSRRIPQYVIVWKATILGSFGPDISVHGHSVSPSSTTKAVYSLQPDYSLERLPLTEDEMTRLFSHITRCESRMDDRVASLLEQDLEALTRRDPDWFQRLSTEQDSFPPDPYWEEKVDPHLKVVEPPPTVTGAENTPFQDHVSEDRSEKTGTKRERG
jgi:hypothetical protein